VFALRTEGIGESATLALNSAIKARIQAGDSIINLTAGEPEGTPPESAEKAILHALQKGLCKYTPVSGTLSLRNQIIHYYLTKNLRTNPDEIMVTTGAKQAIFNAFQALLNPGDEVLIFKPYWLSYPSMARMAGATPVMVPLAKDYQLDMHELESKLHRKTKCLI
jgi:aspartate aminotransferase